MNVCQYCEIGYPQVSHGLTALKPSWFFALGTFWLLVTSVAYASESLSRAEYRLSNGLWFDGTDFVEQVGFVVDGVLSFGDADVKAQAEIDLSGGYVLPPFCEAHNHNIGGSPHDVEQVSRRYLEDGVFYTMMPGSFHYYRKLIADRINTSVSVDVSFANNGLTGSGGHPRRLREMLMERYGRYAEFTQASLPDQGYFEADTSEELRAKWMLIKAEKPDFVKVMLLYAEEYEYRKNNAEFYGSRGLDPRLLPELVQLAHGERLRVAVHVETDFDMKTALKAGADIIAHLPSHSAPVRLSDETIALAKETGAALITTLSLARRFQKTDPSRYKQTLAAQRDNLLRLRDAGVRLVVGSDNVFDTSRGEVAHLASLNVFDRRTLLRMWTEYCAATVFPDRKIGRLANGYEASFLVLSANPLTDFNNTASIVLRFKDGAVLSLDEK